MTCFALVIALIAAKQILLVLYQCNVDIVDMHILEAITASVKWNSYPPSVHKKHVLYFSFYKDKQARIIIQIVWCRSYSMRLESVDKIQVEEAILRQLKRSLYTDIPSSYMENIIDGVVPAIGVDFE